MNAARASYDAALCMYHDQALIPIKTLAFDHAVNVTLGLPFVRTSPDHGTAFDIAGTGRANPTSLVAALRLAARLAAADSAGAARSRRERASDGLPPLREVIRRHGLVARKSLGQNFLFDLNLTAPHRARRGTARRRRRCSKSGPGPGGLTRALLALGAARVDRRRARRRARSRALQEIAAHYPGRLDIVAADALDIRSAPRMLGAAARIVANLPYNIATALLVALAQRRALAALVRLRGADVPARSRRTHRRRARLEKLRAAVGAGAMALRGPDHVRHQCRRRSCRRRK